MTISVTDPERIETAERLGELADILDARGATHGRMRDNFGLAAKFWTDYLAAKAARDGSEAGDGLKIGEDDVCVMMAMMKIARRANGRQHLDDHMNDAAVYLIMADRMRERDASGLGVPAGFPMGLSQGSGRPKA